MAIAYGVKTPSNLLLPVIPQATVPTGPPPCSRLRGEPYREYQPLVNEEATNP